MDNHSLRDNNQDNAIVDPQLKEKSHQRLIQTPHDVHTIDISPDGKYLVSAGNSFVFSIIIWDLSTCSQVGERLIGHTNIISIVKYSKNGECIVSSSWDKTIRQWDTQTHKQIGQPLIGHTNRVDQVSYTYNQKYLISCSGDLTIRIWNPKTGKEFTEKRIHSYKDTYPIGLSPTISQIAFGDSRKHEILIWNYDQHKLIGGRLRGHTDTIYSINYSNDSSLIVSCGWDLTIRIWNLMTRTQIGDNMVGHAARCILSANSSPDMKFIITGGSDNSVRIWDRFTQKQVGESLLHHKDAVKAAIFSQDGKYIITGGCDQSIIIIQNPYN